MLDEIEREFEGILTLYSMSVLIGSKLDQSFCYIFFYLQLLQVVLNSLRLMLTLSKMMTKNKVRNYYLYLYFDNFSHSFSFVRLIYCYVLYTAARRQSMLDAIEREFEGIYAERIFNSFLGSRSSESFVFFSCSRYRKF